MKSLQVWTARPLEQENKKKTWAGQPEKPALPGGEINQTKYQALNRLFHDLLQGFRFHPGSQDRRPLVHKRDPSFWEGAGLY